MKRSDPYRSRPKPEAKPQPKATRQGPKGHAVVALGDVQDQYLRGKAGGENHPFYLRGGKRK